MQQNLSFGWASTEFSVPIPGCRPQMNRTLAKGAMLLYDNPHTSFSMACGNSRRVVSRVLGDQRLSSETLLTGHRAATLGRIKEDPDTDFLLPTDTVFFTFPGHQKTEGLNPLQGKIPGIVQHNVMVINARTGLVHGVPVVHNWTRGGHQDSLEVESNKWFMGLDYANELAVEMPDKRFTVVNDRESDILGLFKASRLPNVHLINRVHQPRRYELISAEEQATGERLIGYLSEIAQNLPIIGIEEVSVYRENRRVRITIEMSAAPIRIHPDKHRSERLHSAEGLNLVVAREIAAVTEGGEDVFKPEGASEWLLVTSLPVSNLEEVRFVVRSYGLRWRIERLHYTMKSGALNSEWLQFDDVRTLCNGLVLNTVVAWKILCLVYEARQEEVQARHCLDDLELTILSTAMGHPVISMKDACLAIGSLVKFEPTKAQPYPGIKVVTKGMYKLKVMCETYEMFIKPQTVPR